METDSIRKLLQQLCHVSLDPGNEKELFLDKKINSGYGNRD